MVPLEGPVSVGALVDAIMLGCLGVQSCMYYKNTRSSAWLLSILVSLILFLSLSHLGCLSAWLWADGRANIGDASVDAYAATFFGVSNILGALISFSERCFFTHRIRKVFKNQSLAFVISVLCIFSFTAALGTASLFFTNATASLMPQLGGSSWIFLLDIISGFVCDLAISTNTAFCLRYQTPAEGSDTLGCIARLFLLVAETGCMTSLFDLAFVIVYWLTKSNFTWLCLLVFMPGVFANTVLLALNAREYLCANIEHRRTSETGESPVDRRGKPPILIAISKQVENSSESNSV